jgi:hypothetical protein
MWDGQECPSYQRLEGPRSVTLMYVEDEASSFKPGANGDGVRQTRRRRWLRVKRSDVNRVVENGEEP